MSASVAVLVSAGDTIVDMSLQVSNLFARDEMDEILNELIVPMKKAYARRPPTLENLYEFYMQRCRENLHVVLCFSPVGEKFRNR